MKAETRFCKPFLCFYRKMAAKHLPYAYKPHSSQTSFRAMLAQQTEARDLLSIGPKRCILPQRRSHVHFPPLPTTKSIKTMLTNLQTQIEERQKQLEYLEGKLRSGKIHLQDYEDEIKGLQRQIVDLYKKEEMK